MWFRKKSVFLVALAICLTNFFVLANAQELENTQRCKALKEKLNNIKSIIDDRLFSEFNHQSSELLVCYDPHNRGLTSFLTDFDLDDGQEVSRNSRWRRTQPFLGSPTLPEEIQKFEIYSIEIISGDTLWSLSEDAYGTGLAYHEVFGASNQQLENADTIIPGDIVMLPTIARKNKFIYPGGREANIPSIDDPIISDPIETCLPNRLVISDITFLSPTRISVSGCGPKNQHVAFSLNYSFADQNGLLNETITSGSGQFQKELDLLTTFETAGGANDNIDIFAVEVFSDDAGDLQFRNASKLLTFSSDDVCAGYNVYSDYVTSETTDNATGFRIINYGLVGADGQCKFAIEGSATENDDVYLLSDGEVIDHTRALDDTFFLEQPLDRTNLSVSSADYLVEVGENQRTLDANIKQERAVKPLTQHKGKFEIDENLRWEAEFFTKQVPERSRKPEQTILIHWTTTAKQSKEIEERCYHYSSIEDKTKDACKFVVSLSKDKRPIENIFDGAAILTQLEVGKSTERPGECPNSQSNTDCIKMTFAFKTLATGTPFSEIGPDSDYVTADVLYRKFGFGVEGDTPREIIATSEKLFISAKIDYAWPPIALIVAILAMIGGAIAGFFRYIWPWLRPKNDKTEKESNGSATQVNITINQSTTPSDSESSTQ